MFLGLWLFLIAGIWIVGKKTDERIEAFASPYGAMIEKISEGVSIQLLFSGLLGISIGVYISGRMRLGASALLLELHDEIQELKNKESNRSEDRQ